MAPRWGLDCSPSTDALPETLKPFAERFARGETSRTVRPEVEWSQVKSLSVK